MPRLGSIKSLYSDSFFTREEFDGAYGMAADQALKRAATTAAHARTFALSCGRTCKAVEARQARSRR